MLSMFKAKGSKVASTAFSEFIRTGASKEKKKVFVAVLKASTSEQNRIILMAKNQVK